MLPVVCLLTNYSDCDFCELTVQCTGGTSTGIHVGPTSSRA
jgi:hypothetical protein